MARLSSAKRVQSSSCTTPPGRRFGQDGVVDALPKAPVASTPAVRAVMQGNRKRGTRPERLLRSALTRRRLRYRLHLKIGSGPSAPRPDIVFARQKVAVFVDGCFWHGCPSHGVRPRTNPTYWNAKILRNQARDQANTDLLATLGWQVIRVWEHEDPEVAADRICAVLGAGASWSRPASAPNSSLG